MPPSQMYEDDIEVPGMSRKTTINSISGLVAEYIVAIDVTRVRFPADASACAGASVWLSLWLFR